MGASFWLIYVVIAVICIIASFYDKQKEDKEKLQQHWVGIKIGMNKSEVEKLLGNPHAAVKIDELEAWRYGPTDNDGEIRFLDGKVVAFTRPN